MALKKKKQLPGPITKQIQLIVGHANAKMEKLPRRMINIGFITEHKP